MTNEYDAWAAELLYGNEGDVDNSSEETEEVEAATEEVEVSTEDAPEPVIEDDYEDEGDSEDSEEEGLEEEEPESAADVKPVYQVDTPTAQHEVERSSKPKWQALQQEIAEAEDEDDDVLKVGTGGKHDADRGILSSTEYLDDDAEVSIEDAGALSAMGADAAIAAIVRSITRESTEREICHYEETDRRLASLTSAMEQLALTQKELLKAQKTAIENEAYRPKATVSDSVADKAKEAAPVEEVAEEKASEEKSGTGLFDLLAAAKKKEPKEEPEPEAVPVNDGKTVRMPAIQEKTAEEVIAEKEALEAEEEAMASKKGKKYSAPKSKGKGSLADKLFGAFCIALLLVAVFVMAFAASRVFTAMSSAGSML